MFLKKWKKNHKNSDYQKLFAFDFDEQKTFFNDINNQKHFIKMIKINDISAIFNLNKNSSDFVLSELKTILKMFNNFKIIKILKKPELLINIDRKYEIIDQINHSFYSSTYLNSSNHQSLLAKKFQLLNLIKTKHNEEIDWINQEKNVYLFFSETNQNLLEENLLTLMNLLNKSNINFDLLSPWECFDEIKLIFNKDDSIKSNVLNIDSHIDKKSLFNIDTIKNEQDYLLINQDKYLSLFEIDLGDLKNINDLFECFKNLNIDLILDFKKSDSEYFNFVKLTLINHANSLKELNQKAMVLKKNINSYHFKINLLVNQQLEAFNHLIIPYQANKNNLIIKNYELFDKLINLNFLSVNKLCPQNSSLIGFNKNNELIYTSAHENIMSIGKPENLFMKLINEKIAKLEKVIIYDYDQEFFPLCKYYNQIPFDFKTFMINPFDLDHNQEKQLAIKAVVNLISAIFKVINPNLNTNELLILKQAINNLYANPNQKKSKAKSKKNNQIIEEKTKIDFSELLNQLNQIPSSENLVDICDEILTSPFLKHHFNQSTDLELKNELLINLDLSSLKKQKLNEQKIALLILNNFINSNLESSTIYLNNLDVIINEYQLLKQLEIVNSKFNVYGYIDHAKVNLDDTNVIALIKSINCLNLIPWQDYQNQFWQKLLTILEINCSEKEINNLNTINNYQYLMINGKNKYWYINKSFEFESNAWKNKILNRELSKYEINKVLRTQIDEIETEIYYIKKSKEDLVKNFLIKNVSHPDVQQKIRLENQKYIKKLF